ncbi:MAG: NAD(P)H-dependent oxidoreductase [Bacteroidia bacterium]|nr:NAD(P)H-dependent oxidoreductase [Bacteroidia bacterium]NNJ55709.1 NAD(P)H-dependent oxidoreductase [Bacteroidia bacterium]
MKVAIISGSARKSNNTIRVAKSIQKNFENSVLIDFQDYDFPNLSEGFLRKGSETEFQRNTIEAIRDAELLFVLTPEYNWFPSAELVSMIHQLGTNDYSEIFDKMVIASVGVSSGRGGRMPAVQLGYVFNKIFSYFNLNSITSPRTFEAQEVLSCIDESGQLLENEAFNQGFTSFISYSLKVAKRWHQSA